MSDNLDSAKEALEAPEGSSPETPETYTEVAEAQEEPSEAPVSIDDFLRAAGQSIDKPKEEVKEEKPQEKEIKEEKVEAKEVKKEVKGEEEVSRPSTGPLKRDFSGLKPQEVAIFKTMSRQAFDFLKPRFLKLKELEPQIAQQKKIMDDLQAKLAALPGRLPDNYYEHPEAYRLSQGFTQESGTLNQAVFEANHWTEQLKRIERGEPWLDLEIDSAGRIAYREKEPDANSKIDVHRWLGEAQHIARASQDKLKVLAATHGQRFTALRGTIAELERRAFPRYEDAKHPSWVDIKAVQDALPPELKGNPLASLVAKSYALIKELQIHITNLERENTTIKANRADAVKAGPTKSSFGAGSAEGTDGANITIDDFYKAMR